ASGAALMIPAGTIQVAYVRDLTRRRFVTFDGEASLGETVLHARGGEPQLAVHALTESPPIRLPYPDEIVHLHRGGLVLEKARYDEVVPRAERDHPIEVPQLAAEVAEREHEPPAGHEPPRYAVEDAIEVGLALQMRERIAHADDQLDARWHEPSHVADVARDRLDGQTARPVPQLGEESLTEVDGQHPKAEPRQRDGLDAIAAAETD